MKQKTWTAKAADLKSDWYVVDATDQVLGRLASGVAAILRGKHKPTYTPHLNSGDHVVVINAAKVKVTGSKMQTKEYTRYTGYPGGLRRRSLAKAQEIDPTFLISHHLSLDDAPAAYRLFRDAKEQVTKVVLKP